MVTQYHHAGPTEGPNADAGAVGLTSSKTGPAAVNDGGPEPVRTEATTAPADSTTQIAPTAIDGGGQRPISRNVLPHHLQPPATHTGPRGHHGFLEVMTRHGRQCANWPVWRVGRKDCRISTVTMAVARCPGAYSGQRHTGPE